MFGSKKNTFDKVAERFRKSILELENVEVEDMDRQDLNEKTIESLQQQNEVLQEERRRASRMRTKLQDLVGDD